MAFAVPLALAAAGGTGVMGAFGAIEQSQASANAAKYNATIAKQNAAVSRQNAAIVAQAGEAQAGISEQKTRATSGAIRANQGASGVDVNSGSAVDVQSSVADLGELDALTVRSNAVKEAYGYKVQATNQEAESQLDSFQAKNDIQSGYLNATSTLLGAAGDSASKYEQFKMAGAFSG